MFKIDHQSVLFKLRHFTAQFLRILHSKEHKNEHIPQKEAPRLSDGVKNANFGWIKKLGISISNQS